MIDPFEEEIFTFAEINEKTGLHLDISTYHRWRRRGVRKKRVDSIRIGGVYYTSIPALRRFFAALSQQSEASRQPTLNQEREAHVIRELESRFKL